MPVKSTRIESPVKAIPVKENLKIPESLIHESDQRLKF